MAGIALGMVSCGRSCPAFSGLMILRLCLGRRAWLVPKRARQFNREELSHGAMPVSTAQPSIILLQVERATGKWVI